MRTCFKGGSKGSAAVFLLGLLPVLLSLAALAGAVALGLAAHATNLLTCRLQLLDAQQSLVEPLNQLLDLNPQAIILHERYTQAKAAALAMPGNPIIQAHLQAQILINRQFQNQQQSLLQKSKTAPQMKLQQLPMRMLTSLAEDLPFNFSSSLSVQLPQTQLAIVPMQLDELTYEYETAPGFSEKQNLTVSWKLHIKDILPAWLQNSLVSVPDLQGQCSATIEKGENQWKPILTADKS